MRLKRRIQPNGINRFVPPAIANPGDCTTVVNLRKRAGSLYLRGINDAFYTPDGGNRNLIFIHTCYDGEHHITEDEEGIYYEVRIDNETGNIDPQSTAILAKSSGLTILSIRAIGNTLILFCPENTYYFLYKEGKYLSLGERPEIPILSFYPQGLYPIDVAIEAHDFSKSYTNPTYIELTDSQFYTSKYYASFFKCQEEAWENHRFIQPILVRYAITLYDGSRLYASAPVMISQADKPFYPCQIKLPMRSTDNVCFGTQAGDMVAYSYELKCKIHNLGLANWKDIIRSIDIFVAPEATIFESDLDVSDSQYRLSYSIEKRTNALGNPAYTFIGVPNFDTQEIHKRYLENSVFYKIASLDNWDELEENTELTIACEVRPDQLVHEEILSVDNTSLLSTGAKVSYVHNKRLHIANLTKHLFPGFPAGIYNVGKGESPLSAEVYIRTYLKSERGESQVVWHGYTDYFYNQLSPLLSYPDSNAYKMEIVVQTEEQRYSGSFNLTASKYENRAEYLDESFLPIALDAEETSESLDVPSPMNDLYTQPNILRVSEYENPFIFPVELTYPISNSAITGIASITSALSEGQFGEFSLYLFTEEGIWALQNGDSSVCYESQHQLSRIGISLNTPIIPIESGILFVTDKGLFSIEGSIIQEVLPFSEAAYESATPIKYHGTTSYLAQISLSEVIKKSRAVYNPIEKELLFTCSPYNFTLVIHLPSLYIYCLDRHYVHIYSDATHQFGQILTGCIYNIQKEYFAIKKIYWASRPITLSPENYQRWHEVSFSISAKSSKLKISMWGGNDAEGVFNLVSEVNTSGSIPGQILLRQTTTPYKYFRLILSGEISTDFHFSAIDISAQILESNRLR